MYQLFQKKNIAFFSMTLAVAWSLLAGDRAHAQKRVDFGAATTAWEDSANWLPDGVPLATESPEINRSAAGDTINLSSTQTVLDMAVSFRTNSGNYLPGNSTLNILPNANLTVTGNSTGIRVGRGIGADAVGSSKGLIIQTGGVVQIDGANGLRLSQADGSTIADSLYQISGGTLRGGATVGALTASLNIGNTGATYGLAEFHVVGSGLAASPRFVDVALGGSTVSSGIAQLHFTLDNGGVTPIIAEDEMQFRYNSSLNGVNQLVVDLAGLPPLTDITLVTADRLNINGGIAGSTETFTGRPDLSPISASFAGITYNWLLDYTDASDNGVLDASIVLRFQSVTAVPEFSAFALVGLVAGGSLSAYRLRRRRAV